MLEGRGRGRGARGPGQQTQARWCAGFCALGPIRAQPWPPGLQKKILGSGQVCPPNLAQRVSSSQGSLRGLCRGVPVRGQHPWW